MPYMAIKITHAQQFLHYIPSYYDNHENSEELSYVHALFPLGLYYYMAPLGHPAVVPGTSQPQAQVLALAVLQST